MRAALLLGCLISSWGASVWAQGARPSGDTMAQRVEPCTECHGAQGRATADGYYPRIAGKPAGYLFNQLLNFRDGRRVFPEMVYLAQFRSDSDLEEIAAFFSAQHPPYPPPRAASAAPAVRARGRQLAFEGDAATGVPACRTCHGAQLLGVDPAVPGLLGLSQDYIQSQLGAWRAGTRRAQAPDCMAVIARRLSPVDVSAVAGWLASQTAPTASGPAAAFEKPPPMPCGSLRTPDDADQRARSAQTASSEPGPDSAEQGRLLTLLGDCEGCHTARGGAPFAGGRPIATSFGVFYSPNITPDAATGIGRWSEQDFWRALHEGKAPDGRLLYPVFPYTNFTKVTRADADAIFAYLRTLPPVVRRARAHELRFPYRIRWLLAAWRELYFRPGVYQPDSRHDAQWNRGAYLVEGLAHCGACHEERNALGAVSPGSRAGGLVMGWYAPSLFSTRQAGLATWSGAQIATLLSAGEEAGTAPVPHAAAVSGPMAEVVYESLQNVPAADLEAMAAYLKSLPPIPNASRDTLGDTSGNAFAEPPLSAHDYDAGEDIYARECAGCHGADGEGHEPAGPPLRGNRAATMPIAANAIRLMLFGGFPPDTRDDPHPCGMPPYYPVLSDAQIAAVLTVVRTSWGNRASAVSAWDVANDRGSPLW